MQVRKQMFWIAAALFVYGCGSKGDAAAPSGAGGPGAAGKGRAITFPVEVAAVTAEDVQYSLSAVGGVEAYEKIQVTARVSGVVERVLLTEGQEVKQGQALVEIEPRRFQVAVRAADASLARTRASIADAQAGIARREAAVAQSPGLIPVEEIESWRTKLRLAQAEELAAQATLDQAALNLRDAYVRADAAGTIETRSVQTGQYAQPGVVLATLVRRDPLLMRFAVPESDATGLHTNMSISFRVRGLDRTFHSKVTHVAQLADPTSRMVTVTSEVDREERDALRPGAFTEVTVPLGAHSKAPVVPEGAVRPSEKGFIAFVVQDGVAKERVLTLGMHTADGRVEVRSGISPGESLVVRGGEGLRDGVKVRVEGGGSSKAAHAEPLLRAGGKP